MPRRVPRKLLSHGLPQLWIQTLHLQFSEEAPVRLKSELQDEKSDGTLEPDLISGPKSAGNGLEGVYLGTSKYNKWIYYDLDSSRTGVGPIGEFQTSRPPLKWIGVDFARFWCPGPPGSVFAQRLHACLVVQYHSLFFFSCIYVFFD